MECKLCNFSNPRTVGHCLKCKYPFNGSEQEQSSFVSQYILERRSTTKLSDSLGRSQWLLFIVAGILLVQLIVIITQSYTNNVDLAINIFTFLLLSSCALFIRKAPVVCSIAAFLWMLGLYALNGIIDPTSIWKGIILKVFLLGSLGYCIILSFQARRFDAKYNNDLS